MAAAERGDCRDVSRSSVGFNQCLMVQGSTSSKAERMREYLDTENVPELTPEEMELIEITGAETYGSLH